MSGDQSSPRPWSTNQYATIMDAEGEAIFTPRIPSKGRTMKDNAELIVRAVNGREDLLKAREMLQAECRGLAAEADRMAEFVRKLCDMVADHPIWRPSEAEQWLIAEARKALGEAE